MLIRQHIHKLSKTRAEGSLSEFYFLPQYFGNAFLLMGEMERKTYISGFAVANMYVVINSFIQFIQTILTGMTSLLFYKSIFQSKKLKNIFKKEQKKIGRKVERKGREKVEIVP